MMKKKSLFVRACVLVLMCTGFIALFARPSTIPTAHAAGANPIIHWDSTMIYAGQNNGYPWGPVGENASVVGANFVHGQQLTLVLVQGDSNNNKFLCKRSGATVGSVTANANGTFQASFSWPSAAGQVNSEYSICSILTSGGQIVSNVDDGPFTVLTSNPPSVATTANSPMPGSMITVTGQNWVPAQTLTVVIVNQSHTELTSAQATSTGLNSGTFSISMTIPSNAVPGSYHIVGSSNGNNNLLLSTSQSFTIVPLQPTPTPTPSPTATPTATATATATDTPVATDTPIATNTPAGTATSSTSNNGSTPGGTDNSSGGSGPSGIVLGLFIAIAIVLLSGIGLVVFIVLQRSSSPRKSPGGGPPGSNGYPVVPPGSGGSYNAFGQAIPQGGADFAYPIQQSGAYQGYLMQQSGAATAFDQSFQQSSPYPSGYGQPTPMQPVSSNLNSLYPPSYAQPTVAYASCRTCGRPLMPNDPRCITCGMPTGI